MNMIKYLLTVIFVLINTIPKAYSGTETISISGSSTVKKYIEQAAIAYSTIHPEISFNINGGGSTSGFGEVTEGRVDIGMMSRELNSHELLLSNNFQHFVIAYDAIVPIVSNEIYQTGGITEISVKMLAKIYQGEITNWKQLGGQDSPILVIDKEVHHGTRYIFAGYILGDPLAPSIPGAIILDTNDDILNIVEASDQAIAYGSFSDIHKNVHAIDINIQGKTIIPNAKNIKDGTYPLSRKLYLLTAKTTPSYVNNFIQFILSDEGQKIAKKVGYLTAQNIKQ